MVVRQRMDINIEAIEAGRGQTSKHPKNRCHKIGASGIKSVAVWRTELQIGRLPAE
jgi:hypothetical protein